MRWVKDDNGGRAVAANPRLRQIGNASALTGLSARTLRYYHELGLVVPRARVGNGTRLYTWEDLERVEEIKILQRLLGLSLRRIKDLLADASEIAPAPPGSTTEISPVQRRTAVAQAIRAIEELALVVRERQRALGRLEARLARRGRALHRLLAKIDAAAPGPCAGGGMCNGEFGGG
ncbi:MAG TPA: MerR family transcriptional regulator [bacterium]|nr:MerR family transcriptional regulator [bacterium]